MEGFFVFDMSNDLLFKYTNKLMCDKLAGIAKKMGLTNQNDEKSDSINSDTIIHIFNPLLANLRFMLIQFDNSFNYVKCQHGFNIVFDESFGFLFITITDDKSIEFMQRKMGVLISFIRFLLGSAIYQIKTDNKKSEMLLNLIAKWKELYEESQDICLEVIEQLSVNKDVKNNIVSSLEVALEKLKQDPQSQRNHAIIFVGNKFLSMYSMRTSSQLVPADILFLNIYCQSFEPTHNITSCMLFMSSNIPHMVHRVTITPQITVLLLSEFGNTIIATNLYETFQQLNKIKILQSQADMDNLIIETEKLDRVVKNIIEIEKKIKTNTQEMNECVKNFQNKYESLKKKYVEMLKIMDRNQLVKVESYFPYFVEATKELHRLSYNNLLTKQMSPDQEKILHNISALLTDRISKFAEFLEIKLKNNFTISSYLEDFAGLIHFIFIDRQRGTCFTTNIDQTAQETSILVKKKVWNMIETARVYLQNGQTSVIWKDFGFSYSYSLWFEDSNGQTLKPKDQGFNTLATRSSHVPGILAQDYYQNLIEALFPKAANGVNKIKCYELFTIHLGLVTPHLQVEHSRRLIATIFDLTEMVNNNLFDLL